MAMVQPVELKPKIWQIPAQKPGGHVYLIKGESKNILIDTGMAANFPLLAGALLTLGVRAPDVHFVILTHEHFDHTGATSFFENAVVAAHSLAANKIELQDEFVTLNKERNTGSKPFYAHLWLEDGVVIHLGNYELQVIHSPGHTSGCICLYEPREKLLFTGDAVFAGGLLSDIAGSGNISDYVRSLQRLANLKIKAFYLAHGLISDRPEEDIRRAQENARTIMEESRLLFETLAKSEAREKILKRLEKAPLSGMSRPKRDS